jgi:prepilin-type processing-associated H-X9-DG protein
LCVLLVIGGVLAVTILPVVSHARARARQAVCLANVKTIAQAIRMYLADHDSHFPPGEHRPDALAYFDTYPGEGGQSDWDPEKRAHCNRPFHANPYLRWPVILDPYLVSRDVWRCPEARLQSGAFFINSAPDWLAHLRDREGRWGQRSPSHLCIKSGSWPRGWGGDVTDSLTQNTMAYPISGKGRTASPGMFLQSIAPNCNAADATTETLLADPASYVICADAGVIADDFCTGTLAYPDLCHLECAGPGDWEADWENCPWSRACGATEELKLKPALRLPYARHYGGVNIGFADGHASWFHSEQVIAESPSHGDYSRGRLRGVEPWGPTHDAPWYDPDDGIYPLY